MSYGEFLLQWYNLPWLAAGLGGALAWLVRRGGPGATGALVAGIAGLTLNGGLHDLGLGPIGARFPIVAASSLLAGVLAGWGLPRLRRRILPPVTGVTFNEPGMEGREVIVLSASLAVGDVGRARHRDADGVVHVVRVVNATRAEGNGEPPRPVRFGARLALGPFDEATRAYEIRLR